jgi:hypothetical protein
MRYFQGLKVRDFGYLDLRFIWLLIIGDYLTIGAPSLELEFCLDNSTF